MIVAPASIGASRDVPVGDQLVLSRRPMVWFGGSSKRPTHRHVLPRSPHHRESPGEGAHVALVDGAGNVLMSMMRNRAASGPPCCCDGRRMRAAELRPRRIALLYLRVAAGAAHALGGPLWRPPVEAVDQ